MTKLHVDGYRVGLRYSGDGPSVICLHCSSSHSGQYKPLMAALENRFSCYAPDVHGYGRTPAAPKDGQPWYVHDLKIVEALLEELHEPVHLVGHSLGGVLSLLAALKWPDRVLSLTLIEPVLFMFLDQAGDPLLAEGNTAAAAVHGYLRLQRPKEAARAFMEFWDAPGAFDAAPDHVRDYVVQTIDRVADDWAAMLPGLPGAPKLDDLDRLTMPIHLVRGGASRASARRIIDLLYERLPHAVVTDIPDAAHLAAAQTPDLVNPYIERFLSQNA